MVAVKAGDVDRTLRRPDPSRPVLLLYGPDTGLVAERARLAAERAVDDPADPFQLIRIEGDVLAADPGRLVDEASTIGMFGARRVIWVRPTTRNIAPAVDAVLQGLLQDTTVVIEASDLGKSAPLRTLCERSPKALALPCYADTDRDLGGVVDEALQAAGLSIGRDARTALISSLGGDRLATRAELTKLLLYAHGQREVTLDDIDAVISDVSSLALDGVIDSAFAGELVGLDNALQRLLAEGTSASTLLGAALRHAFTLFSARLEVAGGKSIAETVAAWRGLHFRRKTVVEKQLGLWTLKALTHVIETLQAAVLDSRRAPDLGAALAGHALLDIAAATTAAKRARAVPTSR
jgi:DNA polymerase III subunit delta